MKLGWTIYAIGWLAIAIGIYLIVSGILASEGFAIGKGIVAIFIAPWWLRQGAKRIRRFRGGVE